MKPVNEADLDWSETDRGETAFRRKKLAAAAADGEDPELGCSLYELPPGRRSWPYHYHTGNAEAFYVLAGSGLLRTPEGEHRVESGDYAACPPGAAGAHRVVNDGEEPLRYLALSTMTTPDVTVYPESETFGVYTGSPPGGETERDVAGYYELDGDVDYWEGES